jgi:hypothetical protein
MRVTGDSPPTEAELEALFGGAEKPAARTWGDTFTDALPMAGGIVGGALGGAAGAFGGGIGAIPGAMAGSAIGGGLGEAARQTARGEDLDYGDIATTGLAEGATAGAFGAAGKLGSRLIRGVSRLNVTPGDVLKGSAKSLVSREMPIIGAVRTGIEGQRASRIAREALGSGTLNTSRVEKLDDVLMQALDEARLNPIPTKIGGTGSPLRAGKNLPVVNAERSGSMISTQPDKWGTTSIHQADDFIDRSRLVDKARPVMAQPPPAPVSAPTPRAVPTGSKLASGPKARTLSEGEERGIEELERLLDATQGPDRVTRGAAYLPSVEPRQQLAEALTSPMGSTLSRAGRSMLSQAEQARLMRALGMR